MSKQKLVYILPEYRESIDTHLYHNYELLDRAKDELDIFLVIEKGDSPSHWPHVYCMKMQSAPLRAIELWCVLGILRMKGYKTFWTHYSFYGAIIAPMFGKSFYWNCGMPWLYARGAMEERIFRAALQRSLLVTGTEGMKRMYAENYGLLPERIFVMPNWVALERFTAWREKRSEARTRLGIGQDVKIVLFLHHLSRRKGADMIEPTADLLKEEKGIEIVVAGSGPLEREIKGNGVRLVGAIPQRDVPMYMAAADIFFMPSEEEGFPHVLLEAMAVGIPIVASDVGGVGEIVPEALMPYVTRQNPQMFAENIRTLIHDASLRGKLSHIEREWVRKYSLEAVFVIFIDLVSGERR